MKPQETLTSLLEIFCAVDDFCKAFLPNWERHLLTGGLKQRQRARSLSISENLTILIAFNQSHDRNFKTYFTEHACKHWRAEFPNLVSYNRFVESIPSVFVPLVMYLRHRCLGKCPGISFIDSTALAVCSNQRIHAHRKPVLRLVKQLFGKLFGDKGYLSETLRRTLWDWFNLRLITKVRKNMKNRLMEFSDRILLRRRAIIESIIDRLKNISQIEHSRYRSFTNCLVNELCGLIATCRRTANHL